MIQNVLFNSKCCSIDLTYYLSSMQQKNNASATKANIVRSLPIKTTFAFPPRSLSLIFLAIEAALITNMNKLTLQSL